MMDVGREACLGAGGAGPAGAGRWRMEDTNQAEGRSWGDRGEVVGRSIEDTDEAEEAMRDACYTRQAESHFLSYRRADKGLSAAGD